MLRLSEAKREDADTLAEIERDLFEYDVISTRQMLYLLKSDTATVIKAELHNSVVGYMILLRRRNSRVLRIYSIGVIDTVRKSGVGLKFLQYAEQRLSDFGCNRLHIEVHEQNANGLSFFLSFGFCQYGRKSSYYTDGATALLLRKVC